MRHRPPPRKPDDLAPRSSRFRRPSPPLSSRGLGPFGPPCALRAAGERLAARGGRSAKKRAVIAVARKLAVTLLALWKTEYSEAALGKFITAKILKQQKRKGSYHAESGTITDKILFCDRALEALKDFNDLSPEASALAEAIYDFIRTQNPK